MEQIDIFNGKVATRKVWRDSKDITEGRTLWTVAFGKLVPGWNPRQTFDNIAELACDISNNGLHEPLEGDLTADGSQFIITDGGRRYRALELLRMAGHIIDYVEVKPNDAKMQPVDKIFRIIASGVHKNEYKPVEIAAAIFKIKTEYNMPNIEIADRMGKSRQWVDNMVKLHKLPIEAKDEIVNGNISATNALQQKIHENREDAHHDNLIGSNATQMPNRDDFPDGVEGQQAFETAFDEWRGFELSPNDKYLPEDTDPGDEVFGLLPPAARPSDDRIRDGGSKDLMGDIDFDKAKTEQEEQVNRVAKNINWLEGLVMRLGPNDADEKDAMHRFQWIREDLEALKLFLSKGKNRGL